MSPLRRPSWPQVFDHHYHFDHLLDTAYEVEGGHPYHFNGGQSPEAASPLSSQGDLTELNGEQFTTPSTPKVTHIPY